MSVQIDMDKVAFDAAQSLGAQLGVLTLELSAQRASGAAQAQHIAEQDAELARLRQSNEQLQTRVAALEADRGEPPVD